MPVHSVVACSLLGCGIILSVAVSAIAEELTYERHIRPILKVHCLDCHGATEELKGNLDLRLRRSMVRGGASGTAIVPNDPEASYLLKRVAAGEMPPGDIKMSLAEIETIKQWIASGAKTARPEPESLTVGLGITPEEREFWSFQPLERPAVPSAAHDDRVRTPIDAFLFAAMKPHGLSFSPDADKASLARRAYLDLLGLPPTPAQIERFVADSTPDAWERLIDELLNSAHYGERWARHWLDIAGYADSEGDTESDRPRQFAYKYRDYVIRSFNSDKPIDQFIQEQLAGDELVPPPHTNLTPKAKEKLVATGFLRMAADQTISDNNDSAKNQVVADTIQIVSSSLLGLSVGCAQCHDHRYDPIPHADYYRIRALFEPAFNWKNWRNPDSRRISLYTDEDRAKASAIERQVVDIDNERIQKREKYIAEALDAEIDTLPEAVREPLRKALKTPGDQRSDEQKRLVETYPSTKINGGNLYQYNRKASGELNEIGETIAELRKKKPFQDFLRVLTEVPGQVPDTYRFHRGDHQQPKEKVTPGVLTIATADAQPYEFSANDPSLPTTGRRLAWARWLTSGKHPLVGRVLVNRVWKHHFGQGIVSTPSDFGKLGTQPSHPKLLDWLACELVSRGWSLKNLHKLIMTSTAYRQTTARNPIKDAVDPDNRLYWRKSLIRLDAEAVRDRILFTTGEISLKMFGPPVSVTDHETGQVIVNSPRRSVYVEVRRTKPVAMLKAFDLPVMHTNCDQRVSSTVAPQALLLMNSDFILERSIAFAKRLRREMATDGEKLVNFDSHARMSHLRRQLTRAWQLAYLREATENELETTLAFVRGQIPEIEAREKVRFEQASKAAAAKKKDKEKKDQKVEPPTPLDIELKAVANVCQALLSSNEFLYVD